MSKAVYYQIYLVPKNGVSKELVDAKINLALDWFRYDNSMWIVYSTADIRTWKARFKSLVEPTGRLFICEIKPENRSGWMNKRFWEWFRKRN